MFRNPHEPALTTASGRAIDYVNLGQELAAAWVCTALVIFSGYCLLQLVVTIVDAYSFQHASQAKS